MGPAPRLPPAPQQPRGGIPEGRISALRPVYQRPWRGSQRRCQGQRSRIAPGCEGSGDFATRAVSPAGSRIAWPIACEPTPPHGHTETARVAHTPRYPCFRRGTGAQRSSWCRPLREARTRRTILSAQLAAPACNRQPTATLGLDEPRSARSRSPHSAQVGHLPAGRPRARQITDLLDQLVLSSTSFPAKVLIGPSQRVRVRHRAERLHVSPQRS